MIEIEEKVVLMRSRSATYTKYVYLKGSYTLEAYPKSQIEYWLYNLVNMESMTEALPFQTEQPIFSKMGGISELSHMDSEERRKYFKSLNKYRTNLSVMEFAIEDGLEKGEHKKAVEIARNAKNMGMEASVISKLTGLPVSDIESL